MTGEAPVPRMLLGGLDEILDDLDAVLPADADATVQAFVQAGGNGGGESAALLQEWISALGPDDARDVMAALQALTDDHGDSGSGHEWGFEEPYIIYRFPGPLQPGWGFSLLCLRYGYPTGSYWVDAAQQDLTLATTGEQFLATSSDDAATMGAHIQMLRMEQVVRLAERQERFADARVHLDRLLAASSDTPGRLVDEYKHLLRASVVEVENPESSVMQYQRLYVRGKELVAPIPLRSDRPRQTEQADRSAEDVHLISCTLIARLRMRQHSTARSPPPVPYSWLVRLQTGMMISVKHPAADVMLGLASALYA
jgi:ubiquitin-like protein Pup